MKRMIAAAALALASTVAMADQAIAERAVVHNGLVLTVQLSDAPTDTIDCKFGSYAARILSAEAGHPGTTQRLNLGCWLVNRDGSIEYSGLDQKTGRDIYMRLTTRDFRTLDGFTEWGDYMGPFMASSAP